VDVGLPFMPSGSSMTVSDPVPPAEKAFYRVEESTP